MDEKTSVAPKPAVSFALCESEATATATTNVFCSESKVAATKRQAGTKINPAEDMKYSFLQFFIISKKLF